MIEITKSIEWDMGHRVPNHKHKCRNPHGHRYRLEMTVSGLVSKEKGTSEEGMVHDFGDIKKHLLEKIHSRLDHCFLATEEDPIFAPLAKDKELDLKIILVPFVPTAENILVWCYERLIEDFPAHLSISRLRLYETPTSSAEYIP
jgi:6-pyruvoyltetrahydropterin/6-carboxytetrahydropterin synthase